MYKCICTRAYRYNYMYIYICIFICLYIYIMYTHVFLYLGNMRVLNVCVHCPSNTERIKCKRNIFKQASLSKVQQQHTG